MTIANSSMALITRSTELKDATSVSELLRVVFSETYGHVLESDGLNKHLETYLSEGVIRDDMASSTYYLVENVESVVGVLKVCLDDEHKAEIAKLYVSGKTRSQGVGSKLMDAALHWAKEQNAKKIWLNVWRENKRAIEFYEKHNFKQVGFTDVFVGEVIFKDYVMERAMEKTV